jgi:hypothetical protein
MGIKTALMIIFFILAINIHCQTGAGEEKCIPFDIDNRHIDCEDNSNDAVIKKIHFEFDVNPIFLSNIDKIKYISDVVNGLPVESMAKLYITPPDKNMKEIPSDMVEIKNGKFEIIFDFSEKPFLGEATNRLQFRTNNEDKHAATFKGPKININCIRNGEPDNDKIYWKKVSYSFRALDDDHLLQ